MKVLVVCIPAGQQLPGASAELIGGAKRAVSAAGGIVEAVVLGQGIARVCGEAAVSGADTVYGVDDDALAEFDAEAYLQALEAVVSESSPEVILFTSDNSTGEVAPRLAHRLGSGAIAEAVRFDVAADGQLVFSRPVYGGRLMAEITVNSSPVVATLMPGSLEALPRDEGRSAEVKLIGVRWAPGVGLVKTLEVEREEEGGVPLEGARVVVSGGRGIGDPANFRGLEELAAVLGGAVGASRAAVDEGWVSPSRQVGQTGKKVAPDLYIAVGISGATQHLAGMSRAKHVVVINTDAEAPFYGIAEAGVAADYRRLLPLVTARLKELLR